MTQPNQGMVTSILASPHERGLRLYRAFCHYLVLMLVLLAVYLVLYFHRLTTIPIHEAVGLAMVLVVAFHIWYFRALFSFIGSQRAPVFLWRDLVLFLLLLSFVVAVASGIAISHYFFRGWFDVDRRLWRWMHTMSTTGMLVTVGLHIGCYWSRFVKWFSEAWGNVGKSKEKQERYAKWARWALVFTALVLALNGLIIMILGDDFLLIMSGQQAFGFYDSERFFFWNLTDDISMVMCAVLISHFLSKALCFMGAKKG